MRLSVPPVLMILLAASALAAAEPAATGRFQFGDVDYAVVDAVAWHTGGEYPTSHVVLSDKPFDTATLGADGVLDDADLMAHPGATLSISYMPDDLVVLGVQRRDATGHGADFRCEGSGLLTLTADDGKTVSGRFSCEEHQVEFSAPVLTAPTG
jgi:hypothetical protein